MAVARTFYIAGLVFTAGTCVLFARIGVLGIAGMQAVAFMVLVVVALWAERAHRQGRMNRGR